MIIGNYKNYSIVRSVTGFFRIFDANKVFVQEVKSFGAAVKWIDAQ